MILTVHAHRKSRRIWENQVYETRYCDCRKSNQRLHPGQSPYWLCQWATNYLPLDWSRRAHKWPKSMPKPETPVGDYRGTRLLLEQQQTESVSPFSGLWNIGERSKHLQVCNRLREAGQMNVGQTSLSALAGCHVKSETQFRFVKYCKWVTMSKSICARYEQEVKVHPIK